MKRIAILVPLFFSACGFKMDLFQSEQGSASGSECQEDLLNSDRCRVGAEKYVASSLGSNVLGPNGQLSVPIPQGYYDGSSSVAISDSNLDSQNIKKDISILGIVGSLEDRYPSCSDDALNAVKCSTGGARYVYDGAFGGRSVACSSGANAVACWAGANQFVTSTAGADVVGSNGALVVSLPNGYYEAKTCSIADLNLTAGNVRQGVQIFGVNGSYVGSFGAGIASQAHRDVSSNQITMESEVSTYAGAELPSGGGFEYRAIPDVLKDDDGSDGLSCNYAPRPSTTCGTSQATIALRIADCASKNAATASWDGATQCNGGQGLWRLVTRAGANKEVWQDQRTGLVWSSIVSSTGSTWCMSSGNTQHAPVYFAESYHGASGTPMEGNGAIGSFGGGSSSQQETITVTFTSATTYTVTGSSGASGCQAGSAAGGLTGVAGSTSTWSRTNYCSFTLRQGSTNFTAGDTFIISSASSTDTCFPGSANQPAAKYSVCYEGAGLSAVPGENWGTGVYLDSKGYMGKSTALSIHWRLPTLADYQLAEVDGVRFVMPDMGLPGGERPTRDGSPGGNNTHLEWTATVDAGGLNRRSSLLFDSVSGLGYGKRRSLTGGVRCVGR
ncbi:hypothetical protein [Bdellovibrio bacteriovorus]|nr:hypothetical protein [Bdellovibrio bacteriovorus]